MALGSVFEGTQTKIRIKRKNSTEFNLHTRIFNFRFSGMEIDTKHEWQMGQMLEVIGNRSEGKVSFDFTALVHNNDLGSPFEEFFFEADPSINLKRYASGSEIGEPLKLVVENWAFDSSSVPKGTLDSPNTEDACLKFLFYNVRGMKISYQKSPDDRLKGNVSFKIPAENYIGSANFREHWKLAGLGSAGFAAEETSVDSEMGGLW